MKITELAIVVCLVGASAAWIWREQIITSRTSSALPVAAENLYGATESIAVVTRGGDPLVVGHSKEVAFDPRAARKQATNYKEFVDQLLPRARAGSVQAQYELANALYYCEEIMQGSYVDSSTGRIKSLEQVQRANEKFPEMIQRQVGLEYERCHGFFDSPGELNNSKYWLDEAANAGSPAAKFMQAELAHRMGLLNGTVQDTKIAQQAIDASLSGDPDVLFGMAAFVDGSQKTPQQAADLISAWWVLGCEKGFDCSSTSEWIKANCLYDPQCANQPSVLEELQRIHGARFGEIQYLADQIGEAVASHSPDAVSKFL
jgi:hypothetical protein